MNHSGNQAWNPTFPFILVQGTNEYIFWLWLKLMDLLIRWWRNIVRVSAQKDKTLGLKWNELCRQSWKKSNYNCDLHTPVGIILPPSVHHVDSSKSLENESIQSPKRNMGLVLLNEEQKVQIQTYPSKIPIDSFHNNNMELTLKCHHTVLYWCTHRYHTQILCSLWYYPNLACLINGIKLRILPFRSY